MRWSRLALYSLYGVIAVIAVTLVIALTIDFGRFKGNAETLVSELLDREFVIEGPLHLTLGSSIDLSADGVRLASTDWSADPVLASVRSVEARINSWSILSGPIEIESLRIDGVRVNLERNGAGENNWTFFGPTDEVEKRPVSDKRFKLPMLLLDGAVTDSALVYSSPDRPRALRLTLGELTVLINEADQVVVDLRGAVNQTPVAVNVTAGGIEDLIDFTDLDLTLAGNLGEISFDGHSEIADLFKPSRPTATLNLSGPNIEYLTDVLDLPRITSGPLDLKTEIAPVGEKMQLNLDGRFGEFSVLASSLFDNLQQMQDIELRVSASGPDAGTVARLLGNENVPRDPFNITGVVQRSGRSLTLEDITVTIGRTQFGLQGHFNNFPNPNGANGTVRVNGPDLGRFSRLLGLPGRLDGPFKLEADLVPLDGGGATVDMIVTAKDLTLSVDGDITDEPDLSGTRIMVRYQGANLQTVTRAFDIEHAPAEPFDLSVNIARVSAGVQLEDGSLVLGDDRLLFGGMVGNKPLESGTDISFDLSGPNLAEILDEFGRDADKLPHAGYKLTGRVSRETGHFVLHDIVASVGDSQEYQFRADGFVTDEPQLLGSRLRVGARGTSLGAITDAAGVAGIPDLPFEVSATIEMRQDGFQIEAGKARFGGDSATVAGLIGRQPMAGATNLQFGVSAPDLKSTLKGFGIAIDRLPPGEFSARGGIRSRGNYFTLEAISASLAGARAELSGKLGTLPTLDGTDIDLRVYGDNLATLLPQEDAFKSLDKKFSLTSNVRLRDKTVGIRKMLLQIDRTELSAEAEVGLEPMLDRGRISIAGTSPDLTVFSSRFAELALVDKVPMDLNLAVHWADNLWTVDGLDLKLAKGTLTSSGTIDGPPNFDRTDLNFEWYIDSMHNLSVLARRELPDQPAHLTFRLVGSEDVMTLEHFEGVFADSDITGDFSLHYGEIPDVHIGFTANRLNLTPFLPPLAEQTAQAKPAQPAKKDKNARVIPDLPVPVEVLGKFLASVDIRIKELIARQRTLRDIVVEGSVADGALTVTHFDLHNEHGGELNGRFAVRPAGSGAETGMRMYGSGLRLGLPAATDEELQALPKYDLKLAFITSGSTVREMAGNVNGYVRLVGGEGRIRAGAMRMFTQDFLFQLLNTINPFSVTDPYTDLKCVTILAAIEDGQVHGKPVLVVQSDKLNIFANTDVDLKTEKLHAEFNTVPQKGLGLSLSNLVNPYVDVSGTLADPSLGLKPESVLLEGGAAVATGGLTILAKSFKDRFLSSKDPCGKAIADADADFRLLEEKYGRSGTVSRN